MGHGAAAVRRRSSGGLIKCVQANRWARSRFYNEPRADVAQLAERRLPKPKVAGSTPVVRFSGPARARQPRLDFWTTSLRRLPELQQARPRGTRGSDLVRDWPERDYQRGPPDERN